MAERPFSKIADDAVFPIDGFVQTGLVPGVAFVYAWCGGMFANGNGRSAAGI
jgi:hypothetical protein